MAVSKIFLNNQPELLQTVLQDSGYFEEVIAEEQTLYCNLEEHKTVLTIQKTGSSWLFRFITEDGSAVEQQYTGAQMMYAYGCSNGIMLKLNQNSYFTSVVLCLNQKQAFTVILPSSVLNHTQDIRCLCRTDTAPVSTVSYIENTSGQMILVPFLTNAPAEQISYTPYVFYIPMSANYTMGYGKILLNGKSYLTDGHKAILDEVMPE
ncbi:MAG: hypothetical protein MJ071_05605 [Oscillospiraceae bacterium]|nr:hypothetical protein [Oscillospiraceae bacterium]